MSISIGRILISINIITISTHIDRTIATLRRKKVHMQPSERELKIRYIEVAEERRVAKAR